MTNPPKETELKAQKMIKKGGGDDDLFIEELKLESINFVD